MGKDVDRILDLLEARSPERASPGTALGREPSWERTPFTMLVSTVISQRNRDEVTYEASQRLFSRWPDAASMSLASVDEIDAEIVKVNFHVGKARAIREIARIVSGDLGGRVPSDLDGLMSLPMVGRKTATCVQCFAFGMDVVCVDTHVHRISNRIGLVSTKTPEETENELMRVVPPGRRGTLNEILVRFGQEVCRPVGPRHEKCPLRDLCDSYPR